MINVRRIDEIHAAIERGPYDTIHIALLKLSDLGKDAARVTERHGAETQLRDEQTGIAEFFMRMMLTFGV